MENNPNTSKFVSIDHFVLGVTDLNKGMEEFAAKTGVPPVIGGVHEGAGTHNALVSLGEGTYLEILAPLSNSAESKTAFGHFNFEQLSPIGWVLGTTDSERVLEIINKFGIPNTGIQPLSRKMEDGKELKWTNIFHLTDGAVSLNPFFIDWEAGSTHPSSVTPKGCLLKDFTINAVQAPPMAAFLKSLPVSISFVEKEGYPTGQIISLGLDTPNGYVQFEV